VLITLKIYLHVLQVKNQILVRQHVVHVLMAVLQMRHLHVAHVLLILFQLEELHVLNVNLENHLIVIIQHVFVMMLTVI
jgi:hypothetical protein